MTLTPDLTHLDFPTPAPPSGEMAALTGALETLTGHVKTLLERTAKLQDQLDELTVERRVRREQEARDQAFRDYFGATDWIERQRRELVNTYAAIPPAFPSPYRVYGDETTRPVRDYVERTPYSPFDSALDYLINCTPNREGFFRRHRRNRTQYPVLPSAVVQTWIPGDQG